MYVCGPTVQSSPAHRPPAQRASLRPPGAAGSRYRGFDVTFVRNVTDIDDKVLATRPTTEQWWALAYRDRARVHRAATPRSASFRPTYEPRATAAIPQMQELIAAPHRRRARLRGRRRTGDVYFDVRSWADVRRAHPPEARRHGGRARTPTRAASATPATSPSGRAQARRAGVGVLGLALGSGPARLAHRVLRDVAALPRRRRSTSTAAGSTCASRTTRTSSPSRPRRATRSRATGCTTGS